MPTFETGNRPDLMLQQCTSAKICRLLGENKGLLTELTSASKLGTLTSGVKIGPRIGPNKTV